MTVPSTHCSASPFCAAVSPPETMPCHHAQSHPVHSQDIWLPGVWHEQNSPLLVDAWVTSIISNATMSISVYAPQPIVWPQLWKCFWKHYYSCILNPDTMTSLLVGSSWHQSLLTPVLPPQSSRLAFPNRNLVTSLTHSDRESSGPGTQAPTPQRGLRAPWVSVHQSCGFLSTPEIQALSPAVWRQAPSLHLLFPLPDCHSQLLVPRSFSSLWPRSVKPFPLPALGLHRIWILWLIIHFSRRAYSSLLMSPLKVYKPLHFWVLSTEYQGTDKRLLNARINKIN